MQSICRGCRSSTPPACQPRTHQGRLRPALVSLQSSLVARLEARTASASVRGQQQACNRDRTKQRLKSWNWSSLPPPQLRSTSCAFCSSSGHWCPPRKPVRDRLRCRLRSPKPQPEFLWHPPNYSPEQQAGQVLELQVFQRLAFPQVLFREHWSLQVHPRFVLTPPFLHRHEAYWQTVLVHRRCVVGCQPPPLSRSSPSTAGRQFR
mmetsp:Transcript_49770/g.131955  ORF Transcript_49770/g.131955 Transcript_49770/m.131955 type:complete len:206 (+) Transcript_49770:1453-2070(+)